MFKKRLHSLQYGLLTLSLAGCLSSTLNYKVVGNTETLEDLTEVHAVQQLKKEDSSHLLRLQSLRDYAFSTGAQAGCSHHTKQLAKLLNELGDALDRVYSFSVWMLPHNVLPPVLVEAKQAVSLKDTQTMHIANRTYCIYKNAKFVSTPPHWRYDYLLRDASHLTNAQPKLLADLLPRNKEEIAIWKKAVTKGWELGIQQARNNFFINLNALARDLNGIILYHQLLAKQMVSAPYIAYSNLGVTGDEKNINIQDQVLRITALSTLKHDTHHWKPILISQDEKARPQATQ